MAAVHEPFEIEENPDLLRLVEDMEATGQPRVLCRSGKEVAVVVPLREDDDLGWRTTSDDDPLWGILRMAQEYEDELDPNRPTDVSTNKYKYLAEAYADLHDRE